MAELILYACPVGELTHQIEEFYARSLVECGPNEAHRYMPHVSLTGFFHDSDYTVPWYVAGLEFALRECLPAPAVPVAVAGAVFERDFHGLVVASPWLRDVATAFAESASGSPTRTDRIRLKDWLHVSLAYGFDDWQHVRLAELAQEMVDPGAHADWEVRLYERRRGDEWVQHGAWSCATQAA